MVVGGATGGGGVTIAPANATVSDPEKIKNSEASTAIAQAKGQVANAVSTTDPVNQVQTPQTATTTTTTTGKVPTAADAVLAITSSTPVKQTLLKNTLGAGQAL